MDFPTLLLTKIRTRLRGILNVEQRKFVNRHVARYFSVLFRRDLSKLALLFGTDKYGIHFYTQHYQHHFALLRKKKLKILEIGIGGYDDPKRGAYSLRMWKAYFPKSEIHGIDIYEKSYHDERRIKTHVGSQVDADFLRKLSDSVGGFDIIIDDGSHFNEHVIESFKILFPLLKPNGIYAVEDTQTSYWDIDGGLWKGSSDPTAPHISINFLKSLVDCVNHQEFTMPDYHPTYFDKHIIAVHFYHNLVFVYKGLNDEPACGPNSKKILD